MNVILVEPEFELLVNGQIDALGMSYLRLGGREIVAGPHTGKLLVNAEIINSTPEWRELFDAFISGGTVREGEDIAIEPGRTVEFTDIHAAAWGPYEITAISNEDLETMFPEEDDGND